MIKIQMILTLIKRETYLRTILVIDCMLSRCVASWNFKLQTISSDVTQMQKLIFKVLTFGLGDFFLALEISQKLPQKIPPPTVLGYNSQGDIELMGHRSQITTTRGISPCNNSTIAAQCYKCTGWRLDRFHITEFLNENTSFALGKASWS